MENGFTGMRQHKTWPFSPYKIINRERQNYLSN